MGGETPKRPPAGTTEVLHQRGKLPFSNPTMAVGGFLVVAAMGYLTLFYKSKPGTKPSDVAMVAVGGGTGTGTHSQAGYKTK